MSSLREKLRKIMNGPSTRDLIEDLESIVIELIERYNPRSIIIAGSTAKSKFVRGLSDIDLLVIIDESPSKDERFILKAIKDVNIEVTLYSLREIVDNIKTGNPFIIDAIESGFEVYGGVIHKLKQLHEELKKI